MANKVGNPNLKAGTSGNPKGRPKGAQNKVTKDLKDKLKVIVEAELEAVPELILKLKPKDRLDFLSSVMKYVIPVKSSVDADIKGEVTSINIRYKGEE